MASFFKDFLVDNDTPGRQPNIGLALAAFGKHPGWKDHVKIGLSTPSLMLAYELLYYDGLGDLKNGPIPHWTELERRAPVELLHFGHIFIWWRGGQFLLGKMLAT